MQNQRRQLPLGALCSLVYFASYVTRTNYGAVMAELIPALELTKPLASMAVTGSFVAYGCGQLVSGWLGDRVEPRRMIAVGLFCTALCNALMTGLTSPYHMAALWSCNGFFQSMLWPPLLRMMASHMEAEEYGRSTVSVLAMSSVGTLVVYLLTPVCITVADWRLVFLLPALFCALVAGFWLWATRRYGGHDKRSSAPEKSSEAQPVQLGSLLRASALPAIALAIILMGMLRDGLTTWTPVYLTEVFGSSSRFSILVSAVLPVFSVLGLLAAAALHRRLRNELRTAFWLYAAALLCSLSLLLLWSWRLGLVLLLIAVIFGASHGINLMLISRVPSYFLRYGCVSAVSGALNAFTYIGSSLSSFGVGRMAEHLGWRAVLLLWVASALLGTLLTLCSIGTWRRFTEEKRSGI